MFEIIHKIPKGNRVNIAFSGGIDSLASALYFRNKGFDVRLLHFHHGNDCSDMFEQYCREQAEKMKLPIIVGRNTEQPSPNQSLEDFWRQVRYSFLGNTVDNSEYVVTGHHLNDAVETWVWSSMHGQPRLIQPSQEILNDDGSVYKLVRPFLLNKKTTMEKYINNLGYEGVYDPSNSDNSYMRNYIRNVMMDNVKHVNPGIEKVIYKKYKVI